MKFYLTPTGQLIEHNPDRAQFRHRNRVGPGLGLLTPEEAAAQPSWREIKRSKFSELMNKFFKTVEDSWAYRGERFRKLPNYSLETWPTQPTHAAQELLLVYHWGRLCYFRYGYGGYGVGILYDFKTLAFARWAKPRHCAPVMNESRRCII